MIPMKSNFPLFTVLAALVAASPLLSATVAPQQNPSGGTGAAVPRLSSYLEGIVLNQNNAPLQGAQVELVGLGQSTITDVDGTYSILLDDPEAEATILRVSAPSWGPNYFQEYLPQSRFVDLQAIPILATEPYFQEISPYLDPVDDLQQPRKVTHHTFHLQSRGSWTSPPFGPNGGEAESSDHQFKVVVPPGVFHADYRVVVTKIPEIAHSDFSSISGRAIEDLTALEFEVVLVNANNQVVTSPTFTQAVTLEFLLPEWELKPNFPGLFRPLGKANVIDAQGLGLIPVPNVIHGWNAADARYSFQLPHFSQWQIMHTGDDATLFRDARTEILAKPSQKITPPDFKVVSSESWDTLATIDVICGAPVGSFQFTEAAGSTVSNAFSVVASADIKPFLPLLTASVDATFSHTNGATKNQEIVILVPPAGQQLHAHWTGEIAVKVLRKKAHLTTGGVAVIGTEISNIVTWKVVATKTGGEDC